MSTQYVVTSTTRNLVLGAAALLAVGTGVGTVAAGDDSRITGAIQSSVLTTNGDLLVRSGGAPAPLHVSTDGYVLTLSSGAPVWAAAAGGSGGVTLGHTWERPLPASVPAGTTFLNTDDLAEQVSTGLAASAGVVASGWMQRLGSSFGSIRAELTMGTGASVVRAFTGSNAYTIDATTIAVLFRWNGSVASVYSLEDVASIGDVNNQSRGTHITHRKNGGNVDLVAYSNGSYTVLVSSVNLLAGAVGYHAVCVAPVTVGGVQKWRFSYDGSAVADVNMAAAFAPPNSGDVLSAWSRGDGVTWLNGAGVDLMAWNSTLSNANIQALATVGAFPARELAETASTGAAAFRVQACRYDPMLPALLPARGFSAPMTVLGTVTKVTL